MNGPGMKVILVNPTSKLFEDSRKLRKFVSPILPLGIASIAAVLEREGGIEVKIIDQFAERISNDELLAGVSDFMPDIVAFSCLTSVMGNVRSLAGKVKEKSKAMIVLGGIHPTIFPDDLLEDGLLDAAFIP